MPHIYEEGRVSVHGLSGDKKPAAVCYDLQDEEFKTLVEIDLFAFLPWDYGQNLEDHKIPTWQFVSEAMRSCAEHEELLWQAWENLSNDSIF